MISLEIYKQYNYFCFANRFVQISSPKMSQPDMYGKVSDPTQQVLVPISNVSTTGGTGFPGGPGFQSGFAVPLGSPPSTNTICELK